MSTERSWRSARRAALATGAVVALTITGAGCAGTSGSPRAAAAPVEAEQGRAAAAPGIEALGEGRVEVVPDEAEIRLGVQVVAESAGETFARASERMAALLDQLAASGVAQRDVQTAAISLTPEYERNGAPDPAGSGPAPVAFRASNTVSVTIRDLAGAGELIDRVVDVVGDSVTLSGISFSVADPEPALAEARAEAVADATRRAQQYAEAAGLTLGDVRRVVERSATSPRPMEAGVQDAGAPIAPGTTEVEATVTVVFDVA